tara:strand:- start:1339 stop:1788 length:450 start_codon:yes stop_codon:yes gene_type:complete
MKIFDWLGQITCYKKPWDSFTEAEQKTFNTFIINRFLSMRSSWTDMVNELQLYTMGIPLKNGDVYKLYCDVFPKENRPAFMRYIKGKKEKKYDEFLLNIITEYYHISKSEATDYLDILYLSKEGKSELKDILQKYGTDPQIIKKFKLEK